MAGSNVYAPQEVAGGRDWRRWPALPEASAAAPMALALRRDSASVTADVGAAPGRWMAYWAAL